MDKTFDLQELAQFTPDQITGKDFALFFAGKDNIHGILKHIFSRAESSIHLSMFGYDDPELNDIIMAKLADPNIHVQITLDKTQAAGVHESKILASDAAQNPEAWNNSVVIGRSSTGEIAHTKGFVVDGIVGGEGSTNWSDTGEGIGKKSQYNTQTVFTDPETVKRFQDQLISEHMAARK
jgi:phosphatidylserine/phosphatidylglycerophosphate/cardiolipin synthase-like enzyme